MLSIDCARQPSSLLPLTPPVMGRDGRSTLQCRANAGPERASKGEVRLCRCNARHAVPRPPSAMGQPWPQGRVAEGAAVGTLVQRGKGGGDMSTQHARSNRPTSLAACCSPCRGRATRCCG